jgi:hypothetical protein
MLSCGCKCECVLFVGAPCVALGLPVSQVGGTILVRWLVPAVLSMVHLVRHLVPARTCWIQLLFQRD